MTSLRAFSTTVFDICKKTHTFAGILLGSNLGHAQSKVEILIFNLGAIYLRSVIYAVAVGTYL